MRSHSITFLACLSFALAAASLAHAAGSTLREIAAIELPGKPGTRFDYLKVDAKDGYLLSAHLGADQTYVIELKTNRLIKTIPDTPGVEGIEYVAELDKAYTSNWRDHSIGVIDLKSLKMIKKLPAEQKPDGSTYAPAFGKLYVSDERAKALIVVDVKTDQILKTLRFESETGMPQFDPIAKKIYVNLQDQNVLAVIDPATDTVVERLPVAPCKGNHGMALDIAHRLAFLACEESSSIAIFDLEKKSVTAEIKIPAGVDVIAFDSGISRLYAACGSGAISVIQETDRTHFVKLEDFAVQPKAHSLQVDTATHRLYVPLQEENGKPVAKIIVYEVVTAAK